MCDGETETSADVGRIGRDPHGLVADPSTDERIQREQIFEILSNERRRLVLTYLRRHRDDGRIDFRDLVDRVAAWEYDTSRDQVDSRDRKCVYTALRQTHLPKLDKLGVVEFDQRRGTVELLDDVDEVLLYMKYIPEREIFWSRLYLSLATLCVAAVLLVWGGFTPVAGVSGTVVAMGIAGAFGVSSLVQLYYTSREGGGLVNEPNRY